ncbi:hypothetical protein ACHAWU_006311 [Discostella pseudostelligera]|uniref:YCII-related domain-containing protein n=1 Tax=Discostella pseudostelligera TaxID=259834 RepID=A0ABD3MBL1_9STRA
MNLLPTLSRASIAAIIAARLSIAPPVTRFAVTAFTPLSQTFCSTSTSRTTPGSMSHLFSSAAAASPAPTRYILSYDYITDVLEKRGPFRDGHLGLAKSMVADGTCISGGPTLPPGEGVPNGDAAEKFVAEDPYVSNGIVTGHTISEWSVLLGSN